MMFTDSFYVDIENANFSKKNSIYKLKFFVLKVL